MQGISQRKLGNGNQSNFMVSNDGVQIMDMPKTMGGPRQQAKPSGRATPILIPPVKYLVYNNPQVAYDFLISKGYNVEPNIPSAYQFARIFVNEKGDSGILELIKAAHPDKDLILKATGHNNDESSCCGFNGENGNNQPTPEQQKNATEQSEAIKDEAAKSAEKSSEKSEGGGIKINTQTIIIILIIIVFFLLINRASK
jgi:hypothetical protein